MILESKHQFRFYEYVQIIIKLHVSCLPLTIINVDADLPDFAQFYKHLVTKTIHLIHSGVFLKLLK